MSNRRSVSRWTLSRRLQDLALRIAAGKPVKIGGVEVVIPDRVMVEEELESTGRETELELEISWPTKAAPSKQPKGRRR